MHEIPNVLRFLTHYGYVNTGFVANMPRPLPFAAGLKPEKVLVVGAGTAGLAAAYHLRNFGYQVHSVMKLGWNLGEECEVYTVASFSLMSDVFLINSR